MSSRRSNKPSNEQPLFVEMVLQLFQVSTVQNPLSTQPLDCSFNNLEHYYESFPALILEESRASMASGLDTNKKLFSLKLSSPPKVYSKGYKMEFKGSIPQEYKYGPSLNVLALKCEVREKEQCVLLLVIARVKDPKSLEVEFVLSGPSMQSNIDCFRHKADWSATYLTCLTTFERIYSACISKPEPQFLTSLFHSSTTLPPSHHRDNRRATINNTDISRYLERLNTSQSAVVRSFVDQPAEITLCQGPPGTGKTSTITALLQVLTKCLTKRVMVCAPSNKAVQVLAKRLLIDDPSIRMVLIGVEDKIDPLLLPITYSTFKGTLMQLIKGPFTIWEWLMYKEFGLFFTNLNEDEENTRLTTDFQIPSIGGDFSSRLMERKKKMEEEIVTTEIKNLLYKTLIAVANSIPLLESRLSHWSIVVPQLNDYKQSLKQFYRCVFSSSSSSSFVNGSPTKGIFWWEVSGYWDNVCKFYNRSLTELYQLDADKIIFSQAQVIFCTLSVSGRFSLLENIPESSIDVLVVDEAGQSVEAETMIAFQHEPKQLLLVGDTKQLPATVISTFAKEHKYDRSLMERLESNAHPHHARFALTIQYRMHAEICDWPSQQFYNGTLTSAASVSQHRHTGLLQPAAFYDIHAGKETSVEKSTCNKQEIEYVVKIVQKLLLVTPAVGRIGIITFYAAQVNRLKEAFRKAGLNLQDATKMLISTVDGFQGDECDVIIVSFVRANNKGSIGFLSDERRLNVALTRAKKQLILLGHEATLQYHRRTRGGGGGGRRRRRRDGGGVRAEESGGRYDVVYAMMENLKARRLCYSEEVLQRYLNEPIVTIIAPEEVVVRRVVPPAVALPPQPPIVPPVAAAPASSRRSPVPLSPPLPPANNNQTREQREQHPPARLPVVVTAANEQRKANNKEEQQQGTEGKAGNNNHIVQNNTGCLGCIYWFFKTFFVSCFFII